MIINLPKNKKLVAYAKYLRQNSTLSEVLLWNKLKNKQFMNLDFDRQKIIGNYIVDLYCPQCDLVIEIDGDSHNNKYEYDIMRHEYLVSLGLYVLHVKDEEVKKNMAHVLGLVHSAAERISNGTAPARDSTDWFE